MSALEPDVVAVPCARCFGQRCTYEKRDGQWWRDSCPTCLGTGTNWQIITTPPLTPPARPPSPSD